MNSYLALRKANKMRFAMVSKQAKSKYGTWYTICRW